MTTFPIFNYPSTIAWIDDDALFLKAISRTLGKQYILKKFSNPKSALDFFKDYKPLLQSMPFLRGCSDHESYDMAEHLPVDLNALAFTEIRQNSERTEEVSVIIVDYSMPEINGLDLCRELKNLPMKKILLTGEVCHSQAVSAFNEGVIDRFIRKDSPTLISELKLYFDVLMKQYFIDNTKVLLSHLETDQALPVSDPVFVSVFKEWCSQNNIREYFLADKQGNFCVINDKKEISYLIVHTERTLSEFIELNNDDEKIIDLIKAVSNREKIPFFGIGKEGWQVETDEWSSHFHVPTVLEGREQYFLKEIK